MAEQVVVRLMKRPVGLPVAGQDLVVGTAPMPAASSLQEGEVLLRNDFLALDPAMRGWMRDQRSYIPPVALGAVMRGSSVATVVASRAASLAPGDVVNCFMELGWQSFGVASAAGVRKVAPVAGLPSTVHLSVLGGTGLTAYFGLLKVGVPEAGDTVVVSAAAGATGSVVCQIAKHVLGCRVVGIAGGPDKCRWLRETLGVDAALDYKQSDGKDFKKELRAACPDGVDVFFDNVGGWILNDVLKALTNGARVVLCGAISGYNEESLPPGPAAYMNLISTSSKMEGFILFDYASQFEEAYADLERWLVQGKIKFLEEVVPGLANAPTALLKLFGHDGGNRGRLVIDIHAPAHSSPKL